MNDEEKKRIEEEERLRAKVRFDEQLKMKINFVKSPLGIFALVMIFIAMCFGAFYK